jgi:hypothetical protein
MRFRKALNHRQHFRTCPGVEVVADLRPPHAVERPRVVLLQRKRRQLRCGERGRRWDRAGRGADSAGAVSLRAHEIRTVHGSVEVESILEEIQSLAHPGGLRRAGAYHWAESWPTSTIARCKTTM